MSGTLACVASVLTDPTLSILTTGLGGGLSTHTNTIYLEGLGSKHCMFETYEYKKVFVVFF